MRRLHLRFLHVGRSTLLAVDGMVKVSAFACPAGEPNGNGDRTPVRGGQGERCIPLRFACSPATRRGTAIRWLRGNGGSETHRSLARPWPAAGSPPPPPPEGVGWRSSQ